MARLLHPPLSLAPTPLVAIRLEADDPVVWCKLEYLNPSGSTKDRIAYHILEKARHAGAIGPGSTVVEASSGSTSIALAMACARLGLRFTAFIPDTATSERALMIRAYGGAVHRVSGGMDQAIAMAAAHAAETGAFPARQFENPDNAEAHRRQTATEILAQLPGLPIDAVVSGVGTGGTLVGLHQGLVDGGHDPIPVAAMPTCPMESGNPECGSLAFSKAVPGVIECCSLIYGRWKQTAEARRLRELSVDEERCLTLTHRLWAAGYPAGPSSGLNLAAALDTARGLDAGAVVVTVFPDRMERYFSHRVFGGLRVDG
jgi:cysteine synthase A